MFAIILFLFNQSGVYGVSDFLKWKESMSIKKNGVMSHRFVWVFFTFLTIPLWKKTQIRAPLTTYWSSCIDPGTILERAQKNMKHMTSFKVHFIYWNNIQMQYNFLFPYWILIFDKVYIFLHGLHKIFAPSYCV